MAGRKKNKVYNELGYELLRINNKHAAHCNICNRNLFNTAEARLRAHRNVCKLSNEQIDAGLSNVYAPIVHFLDAESEGFDVDMQPSSEKQENAFVYSNNEETSSSDYVLSSRLCSTTSNQTLPNSTKNRKRSLPRAKSTANTTPDKLSQKQEAVLNESLAQFFFGCNIPLSVVESVHFKNFIKKLSPAYADKVPGMKVLSSQLLDNEYEKCLYSARATMSSDSVLLIHSWKNSSSNSITFVSMLRNTNGKQTFLEAWDLSADNSETPDIVSQSIEIADKMYSTHVYAIVSDALKNITRHSIWISNCNSHIGNLLANDILDKELNLKVTSILKEYKQADLEKKILEQGGTRIRLPNETQWCPCSYRDAYICLIKNAQFMKLIATDSEVIELLFDLNFMDDVRRNLLLLDPICNLIKKCQSSACSAAEAVEMWLNLQLPCEFSEKLKSRQELALNKYALTAFYLHPFLDKTKLRDEHNNIIFEFLFESLDGTGIEEWDNFRNKCGFFKMLYEKDIRKPLVFWNFAVMKYPTLAKLARKLLQIPASSGQIERKLFSNWDQVHSPTGNHLGCERSKKLFYIYNSLRIKDDLTEEGEKDAE